jgi:hypothetical protein
MIDREPCRHGDHPAEGRFTYSDDSGHPCCRACTARLRGVPHGPGELVLWQEPRGA